MVAGLDLGLLTIASFPILHQSDSQELLPTDTTFIVK
jgi:hypothetical protein